MKNLFAKICISGSIDPIGLNQLGYFKEGFTSL